MMLPVVMPVQHGGTDDGVAIQVTSWGQTRYHCIDTVAYEKGTASVRGNTWAAR